MSVTITSPTITGRIEQIEYMVQTDHVVIQENEACGASGVAAESDDRFTGVCPDCGIDRSVVRHHQCGDTRQDNLAPAAVEPPAWKAKCRVVECGYGYDIRCGKWYWIEVVGKWEDINEPGISVNTPTYSKSRLNEAIRDMQDITTPPQDWSEPCSTSSSSSPVPTPSTASSSVSGSSSSACSTSRLRDAGEVAEELWKSDLRKYVPAITADRIDTINAFVEWWYAYGQDRHANAVGIAAAAFISKLKGTKR